MDAGDSGRWLEEVSDGYLPAQEILASFFSRGNQVRSGKMGLDQGDGSVPRELRVAYDVRCL